MRNKKWIAAASNTYYIRQTASKALQAFCEIKVTRLLLPGTSIFHCQTVSLKVIMQMFLLSYTLLKAPKAVVPPCRYNSRYSLLFLTFISIFYYILIYLSATISPSS